MKRRSFLQLIGAVVAAPVLPVSKTVARPVDRFVYEAVTKSDNPDELVWPVHIVTSFDSREQHLADQMGRMMDHLCTEVIRA